MKITHPDQITPETIMVVCFNASSKKRARWIAETHRQAQPNEPGAWRHLKRHWTRRYRAEFTTQAQAEYQALRWRREYPNHI
jgi:hypothetical protein